MLYLDSSALFKHYVNEAGSDALRAKITSESSQSGALFSSVLSYAEIHSAFAKKARKKLLTARELRRARRQFESDWAFGISIVPLDAGVLASVRDSVSRFPLSGADAVQLASALWLRNSLQAAKSGIGNLIFGTSDERLLKAALGYGLQVFNPETV